MERKNIYTMVFLIGLTISTAIISNNSQVLKYAAILILVLSAIKFLLVAFQFMELKKANSLWKTLIFIILGIFVGAISIILS